MTELWPRICGLTFLVHPLSVSVITIIVGAVKFTFWNVGTDFDFIFTGAFSSAGGTGLHRWKHNTTVINQYWSGTSETARAIVVTHTHTRLTALFPGLPGWAGTRKAKPVWILLKQETVSGSGISCLQVCNSLQTDNHASTPPLSFYRPNALPAAQPTASKHWRQRQV